ncbi:TIGR00730 family Rossman fold protein [Salinisphaera sp. P385]|uniref:Cytokinin riboside 5'-monophosphate phosphoribohydrolase n=1 Tax=Spectribacter acetivorans TaxID=3075603 RepID=A0ABU3B8A5_9GAMM|nr:TIGR00730 family Rossman fold protein [Salinisphaera sp. P385]MDT0618713.1 TIGR00730 family Rossman fold protein [Salinisphaera sp. P385]
MTKSYKNPEFMMGPEARPLRILAEYLEPKDRLQAQQVNRALIFFGSARLKPGRHDPVNESVDYYDQARLLAARLARWTIDTHDPGQRYFICTGGGPGIMEAANRGAADVDRSLSMGLNISLPHEQSANPYLSEPLNFEFHYFFMRKFWFMNVAHALVIFPGGFGTMDELFEVLTLIQTGKQRRMPVILYGSEFWRRLIDFDVFVEMGLISRDDRELIHMVDHVNEAFEVLRDALPDVEPEA